MPEVFVGRQPIFDADRNVFAYEMLFRSGDTSTAGVAPGDGDKATSQVIINTFMEIGLNQLVGQHKAFLNFTHEFLTSDSPLAFPKDRVVMEVLEDVVLDQELMQSAARLGAEGYELALDDFIYTDAWEPLVKVAKYIKIDVLAMTRDEIDLLVQNLRQRTKAKLLAEKVETYDDYDFLRGLGFDYFQGYFLSKPVVVKGKRIPDNRMNTMRLLAKLNDPDVEIKALDDIISQDVGLSFKLLRYINSALFALPRKVESIQQAIVFLGMREIKRWASLMAMSEIDDQPHELINIALTRAKMGELLVEKLGQGQADMAFTTGLFSTIDAIMGAHMDDVLESLPLSPEIHSALQDGSGLYGDVLNTVKAYEQWELDKIAIDLDQHAIQDAYMQSLTWSLQASSSC